MTMTGERKYDGESSEEVAENVVLGVDTHLDFHVAVALDGLGRRLGELAVPTSRDGYERLVSWAGKASDPCGAPAWRVPAAMAPGWPGT